VEKRNKHEIRHLW